MVVVAVLVHPLRKLIKRPHQLHHHLAAICCCRRERKRRRRSDHHHGRTTRGGRVNMGGFDEIRFPNWTRVWFDCNKIVVELLTIIDYSLHSIRMKWNDRVLVYESPMANGLMLGWFTRKPRIYLYIGLAISKEKVRICKTKYVIAPALVGVLSPSTCPLHIPLLTY